MPIEIDEVDAEVTVQPQGNVPQEQRRALPSGRETLRWREIACRETWDHARTRACDADD